mmetsp:Transcript_57703/g.182757  ORF Transcript_57703/g.182757 Transcript_57703/m.182757 type:complete len:186 (+) Transcript_57703:1088-1645(+)
MSKGTTPDAVLAFTGPTTEYLCPLSANKYGIEFLDFEVKDYDSGKSLFKVSKDPDAPPLPADIDPELEDQIRTIRYTFPPEFLSFQTVRTSLMFGVGPAEVPSFRMIERHYFKDKLLRSYDFTFGFCIPNSTNSWEAIYPMPNQSKDDIQEMAKLPYGHKSDSFYFVGDELVMHNKAEYAYATPE